jgi:zinc protease
MKRHLKAAEGVFIIILLITFLVCPGLNAAEETLPKPEEIITKNIEVQGGREALKKIKNRKIILTEKIFYINKDAKVTIYQERPDKYYCLTDLGVMGKEKAGSDGKMAWIISPTSGTRLLEGEELSNTLIKNMFDGPDGPDVPYNSMKTEGIEEINGKACYKVVKTPEKGTTRTIYYDKESFMIVKTITDNISPEGTNKIEFYTEEYQKINNILFPYKMTLFFYGRKQCELIFEKVELNIEMQENIFAIPEEIKAIMMKK